MCTKVHIFIGMLVSLVALDFYASAMHLLLPMMQVYNPVKRLDKLDSAVVEEPETSVESSVPVESNPQILPESKLQDSTQPVNCVSDTVTKMTEIAKTPDPIPDAKDSEIENTSDAMPDAPTTGVNPDPQNVPDSHASVPDSTIPMPDSQSANPVDFQNTEMVPDSQTTNCAVSADITPNSNEITTREDQPIPLTPRSAGPRRAASSSSVIGADPIASSGDLAIDSDDVIVMPKDVEDDVLEIAHLNHDWLDKVPCAYTYMYVCRLFYRLYAKYTCVMHTDTTQHDTHTPVCARTCYTYICAAICLIALVQQFLCF